MSDEPRGFSCDPDPEHPGWLRWRLNNPRRYNEAVLGRMLARVELLRETGRLLFLRGLVVQEAGTVASFSGTVRKSTGK